MKITAIQELQISISEKEQQRITLEYLYKKFNWKSTYSICENFVYDSVIYTGSHSFKDTKKIREAYTNDQNIQTIIESIKTV